MNSIQYRIYLLRLAGKLRNCRWSMRGFPLKYNLLKNSFTISGGGLNGITISVEICNFY